MKKIIITTLLLINLSFAANSQEESIKLTLSQVLNIASGQSIDAFQNKNMYLASYWEYRYYQAEKLPSLSMSSNPVDFNHLWKKEYNFETNEDEYRLREFLNSDVSLSLSQNITPLGGQLFLQSSLGMVKNFSGNKNTSYTSSPISIGYIQELNGYNQLKWRSKIEPLKYEMAKKRLIQNNEELNQKAVTVFFNLARAQIQKIVAKTNYANSDTLYKIGKGRFQVGTVTQDELLDLELSLLNAEQALNVADVNVKRIQSSFNSFLGLEKGTIIECVLPNDIPNFKVGAEDALNQAINNNPIIVSHKQRRLEADEQVAYAKSETGLNTSVLASYGLNQSAENFKDLYGEQEKSQRFNIGLNIPIVDWGRRKGRYSMAQSNREVAVAEIEQERIDFEQEVYQGVLEFNLQESQVYNAAKADTVAEFRYEVTFQRFLIGKIDVINLNAASTDRENARLQYVDALNQYWSKYYRLRSLTLFDFENKNALSEEYDKILERK